MKISKIASYLLSIMLVILLGIGVSGCMSEQEEILNYLEEKYGEKFQVVRYWSEYVGTRERNHNMLAYPKGKPELIFQAEKFWDPLEEKIAFADSYVQSKWSIEYTEKQREKIAKLDSREIEVIFTIGAPGEPGSEDLNNSVEKYLEKQGKGLRLSGTVMVAIKCEQSPNKTQEAELLYKIYQVTKDLNFDIFHLEVIFVKPNSYDDAKHLLYMKQADSLVPLEAVGKENFYYTVYLLDTDNIMSPTDILDKFRTGE